MKPSFDSEKPETIGAFAAKTELSKLLRQTRAGKHFIITQRGKPVAELRPIQENPEQDPKRWGDLEGQIEVAEDFCAPIEGMRDYME